VCGGGLLTLIKFDVDQFSSLVNLTLSKGHLYFPAGVNSPAGFLIKRMNKEKEIADYIVQLLREHETLLGSALGAKVKARFSDFNIKIYRNLKTFINLYCSDHVKPIAQHGLDIRWGLQQQFEGGRLTEVIQSPGGTGGLVNSIEGVISTLPSSASPFAMKRNSPWQAFINPTAVETLQVNLDNAEIQISSSGNSPAKPFIPQLDPADQMQFKVILGGEDFWNKWSDEMRAKPYRKYSQTWVDFRFYKLCEFFRQRLTGLGAAETVIHSSLENLKESKSRERLKIEPKTPSGVDSIRDAVLRAVEKLNEDELRQLWLPVGVIHDALRKH
jgi:hypothetical protein